MTDDYPPIRRNVARWLGIKQSTLRGWDARFSEWLETPRGQRGISTRKVYTDNDLLVLQAIAQCRARSLTYEQIADELDAEIARTTLVWPDPIPAPGQTQSPPSDANVSSLTVTERQLMRVQSDLAATAARLDATESERDRLLTELDAERAARIDAERRAAAAEALANRPGLLQRIFRRRD